MSRFTRRPAGRSVCVQACIFRPFFRWRGVREPLMSAASLGIARWTRARAGGSGIGRLAEFRPRRTVTSELFDVAFQGPADLERLAGDTDFLQLEEDLLGHAAGKIDEAVIVLDHNAADVTAFEANLVGNRADDVARLHAVVVADFNTVRFDFVVAATRTSFVAGIAVLAARTWAIAAAGSTVWAARARAITAAEVTRPTPLGATVFA